MPSSGAPSAGTRAETPVVAAEPKAEPSVRDEEPKHPGAEALRAKYGVIVVAAGFLVVTTCFVGTLIAFSKASSVSAALAPVTGVIGAIVGAYFGVQAGASGKEQSDEAARQATEKATQSTEKAAAIAAMVPEQKSRQAAEILKAGSDWGRSLDTSTLQADTQTG
jgi:hypothetical protein